MGQPVDFTGTNVIMKAPHGAENVDDVRAFRNEQAMRAMTIDYGGTFPRQGEPV